MTEIDQTFSSISNWFEWLDLHPEVHDADTANQIGQTIMQRGIIEPLTGRTFGPPDLSHGGPNWREGIVAGNINSRMRAVFQILNEKTSTLPYPKIYCAEAITHMALRLRGTFQYFIGSEYLPDQESKKLHYPVQHQDLTQLSHPTHSFDAVITSDVLEHVPDVDAALAELCRVLRPGGWHISTHPFRMMSEDSDVRAKMVDGNVVLLKEAEYHGNPTNPSGGSLVYEIPGWDIIQRCHHAGFSDAHMRFVCSQRAGILSQQMGIFVLCSVK